MKTNIAMATLLLALSFYGLPASASDTDELETLTRAFLANSHLQEAHAGFWSEELIYTSSAGLRFGKQDIMQGFEGDDEPADEPGMTYSGEEFDIRMHGDTAVVAFKLVGRPADGAESAQVLYYFNTGTFLKRDGHWRAIAWQATRIPPAE
ncbi:MAG: nuclear transport factor 2 family protein [Gammaproteobacteria bacterium]|nr:nuclear transport factor 2 family protein [Gammaproteobacteria bacterium]